LVEECQPPAIVGECAVADFVDHATGLGAGCSRELNQLSHFVRARSGGCAGFVKRLPGTSATHVFRVPGRESAKAGHSDLRALCDHHHRRAVV